MRFRTVLLGLLALAHPARAEWPDHPIQIIVPFPAGGVLDIAARTMAQILAERLGTGAVVVNRDGASGAIGARAVATARPDGNTLGFFPSGPVSVQPQVMRDAGYGPASFRPICQVFVSSFVMVAGQGGPTDARSALEVARTRPGDVAIGFGGTFTGAHFSVVRIMRAAGVELNAVPFRGDPPLLTGLMAGDMPLGVLTLGSAIRNTDRLPVLMTFTQRREPALPDVPTATELGWPVVEEQFGGLLAPVGLPEPVAQRLETECLAAKDDPRVAEVLRTAGYTAAFRRGSDFMAALSADSGAKRATIAEAAMRAD